jgi:thiosulfate/3-mercaptopyruvate sulfurtransferase
VSAARPSPLISAAELTERLDGTDRPALLDVRWELGTLAPARRDQYEQGHIPGAAFVDLDRELSAFPGPGGRHPLPAPVDFIAAMRRAGVSEDRPVVVYDGANSLPASRAWWLLRHYGHPDVRVLDGGLAAWVAAGGPLVSGSETPPSGDFSGEPGMMAVLDADAAAGLTRAGVLLDARAPERYRGDVEPMDPMGGHIPGARNLPMSAQLQPTGRFRGPGELREGFALAGATGGAEIGAYCGSGITAAHTVLALELAGLRGALYPGSWSEWVTDPQRPVATGDEPPDH